MEKQQGNGGSKQTRASRLLEIGGVEPVDRDSSGVNDIVIGAQSIRMDDKCDESAPRDAAGKDSNVGDSAASNVESRRQALLRIAEESKRHMEVLRQKPSTEHLQRDISSKVSAGKEKDKRLPSTGGVPNKYTSMGSGADLNPGQRVVDALRMHIQAKGRPDARDSPFPVSLDRWKPDWAAELKKAGSLKECLSLMIHRPKNSALQDSGACAVWGSVIGDYKLQCEMVEHGALQCLLIAMASYPGDARVQGSCVAALLALALGNTLVIERVEGMGGLMAIRGSMFAYPNMSFGGRYKELQGWLKSQQGDGLEVYMMGDGVHEEPARGGRADKNGGSTHRSSKSDHRGLRERCSGDAADRAATTDDASADGGVTDRQGRPSTAQSDNFSDTNSEMSSMAASDLSFLSSVDSNLSSNSERRANGGASKSRSRGRDKKASAGLLGMNAAADPIEMVVSLMRPTPTHKARRGQGPSLSIGSGLKRTYIWLTRDASLMCYSYKGSKDGVSLPI
ncbi:hypothetical protein CYMTET_23260, partial [Cymbomonas tetramitiformis]